MSAADPLAWIDGELRRLTEANWLRALTCCAGAGATLQAGGKALLNFASNDYLDLASDSRVIDAARTALASEVGAGASPLVSGHRAAHRELEQALAEWEGAEAALVFPSGYAANLGAIVSLVGPSDAVFSDALNHASIIDGCRLSRAAIHVYRHGDTDHLAALLAEHRGARRRLIVTDGLFSMDGDLAPLASIAELATAQGAMLMVDEAHATGVLGSGGRGAAELAGVRERVDVHIGTLSKALGAAGGFVCGRRSLVELLVNRARSYIFSTAAPPAVAAAARTALEIAQAEPARREVLLARAASLRERLVEQRWNIGASQSQIIPLLVGDEATALALSAELRARGLWVPAIRPPSVPRGQSRLRISLSYAHTPEHLERLLDELAGLTGHVASGTRQG
jgi:8-amino-7-oxononanoate synthase